ncbi:MAG: flagellar biosynthesis anti-sigma factor FlgM [Pseudomonadota bacterium]
MLNKIDNLSPSVVRRIEARSAEARASTPDAAPTRISTPPGKTLVERASERAKSEPDVDMARVNAVKTAIARGEFSIDPQAVARAFINMESA